MPPPPMTRQTPWRRCLPPQIHREGRCAKMRASAIALGRPPPPCPARASTGPCSILPGSHPQDPICNGVLARSASRPPCGAAPAWSPASALQPPPSAATAASRPTSGRRASQASTLRSSLRMLRALRSCQASSGLTCFRNSRRKGSLARRPALFSARSSCEKGRRAPPHVTRRQKMKKKMTMWTTTGPFGRNSTPAGRRRRWQKAQQRMGPAMSGTPRRTTRCYRPGGRTQTTTRPTATQRRRVALWQRGNRVRKAVMKKKRRKRRTRDWSCESVTRGKPFRSKGRPPGARWRLRGARCSKQQAWSRLRRRRGTRLCSSCAMFGAQTPCRLPRTPTSRQWLTSSTC
mmetsp:Transcript_23841/g.66134  ORF Transcript_23841/g.66134 Transcript_23841/m.66134 type:complete len:346 (-) Transcript_23841:935-1972(-)